MVLTKAGRKPTPMHTCRPLNEFSMLACQGRACSKVSTEWGTNLWDRTVATTTGVSSSGGFNSFLSRFRSWLYVILHSTSCMTNHMLINMAVEIRDALPYQTRSHPPRHCIREGSFRDQSEPRSKAPNVRSRLLRHGSPFRLSYFS